VPKDGTRVGVGCETRRPPSPVEWFDRRYTKEKDDTTHMKVTLGKKGLLSALRATQSTCSKRSTLPILSHVLIEARETVVTFLTTDLEAALQYTVPSDGIEYTGRCTVDHQALLEIARSIPGDTVTLSFSDDVLRLEADTLTTSFEATDAEDYPNIPDPTDGEQMIVDDVAAFVQVAARVIPSAADDDSRPVLTAVYLDWRDDVLTMVAANAFQMALDRLPVEGGWEDQGAVLVPARTLKFAAKHLPKQGRLTVAARGVYLSLECGPVKLTSRLIEGQYPRYASIIPREADVTATFTVPSGDLLEALKVTAPIAHKASEITRFRLHLADEVSGEGVTISAQHEDMKDPLRFEVATAAVSAASETVLNNRYLTSLTSALKPATVTVALGRRPEASPVKITSPDYPSYIGVCMPMHINR